MPVIRYYPERAPRRSKSGLTIVYCTVLIDSRASALNRERLIRELLRATEWRSKSGVGAFPRVSGQDVVPDELLHYYLTPFPEYVPAVIAN
jgi:hypothetical protein